MEDYTPKTVYKAVVSKQTKTACEKEYHRFEKWRQDNSISTIDETVVFNYFHGLSKTFSPNSLWTKCSMLQKELVMRKKMTRANFEKLQEYMRRLNRGYKPKKSKVLTRDQILRFLKDAPDEAFLLQKVALLMGVFGACRRDELVRMKFNDVCDTDDCITVKIPASKSARGRSFKIIEEDEMRALKLIRWYMSLRPEGVSDGRFFLYIRDNRCTSQPVGKNTLGNVPCSIAKYLGLPDAMNYKGQCLRRAFTVLHSEAVGSISELMQYFQEEGECSKQKETGGEEEDNFTFINAQSYENEAEYMDQDDDDKNDDDSKLDLLDIGDTEILPNEPELVYVKSNQLSSTECDLFGEYIAKHLQQLPLDVALKLQSGIQALVVKTRLEYIREHPSEAPAMVKLEPEEKEEEEEEEGEPNTEKPTDQHASDGCAENRLERKAKRFKPKPTSSCKQGENIRTDCTVFAEHIALQLEQLPEKVTLRLQSDIYDLITQALVNVINEDSVHCENIKAEPIEVTTVGKNC